MKLFYVIILLVFSQAVSEASGLLTAEMKQSLSRRSTFYRQAARQFSTTRECDSWKVTQKIDVSVSGSGRKVTVLKPCINWSDYHSDFSFAFRDNKEFLKAFSKSTQKITRQSNHHVRFRSDLDLQKALNLPVTSEKYRKLVTDVLSRQIKNFKPRNMVYIDRVLGRDMALFSVYPSCEIANQGIKDCRWFVEYQQLKVCGSLDEYSKRLALLRRWMPLNRNYDSIAVMHLKKGSRLCCAVGEAALQTHPALRRSEPMITLPYSSQVVKCSGMIQRLRGGISRSIHELNLEDQTLFDKGNILDDLQIQMMRGGGRQILVLHAHNAEIFNLGIVSDHSEELNVDKILRRVASGVNH